VVRVEAHVGWRSCLGVPTRLRARALSRHWLPQLQQELARIELELEEEDRDSTIRVRLVGRQCGVDH
jgi:vacuolar-type H+-ATPase subunit D/Vma8